MMVKKDQTGSLKWDLDTPALILDLDVVEQNLGTMQAFLKSTTAALRPHVKTYKALPELVKLQQRAGVTGFTCSKLSEAEVLASIGVKDILIANQIVGDYKISRLVKLADQVEIKVAVDSLANAEALSRAAVQQSVEIGVLIEVNIGHNRCGVDSGESSINLARFLDRAPGLKFLGLMGYDGHCTLKSSAQEREGLSMKANALLVKTKQKLVEAGFPVQIVSASGTFTYAYAAKFEEITEIQAGTYLLMDTAFRDAGVTDFGLAMSVLTTVISRPSYPEAKSLAIIDIGRKGISPQLGLPEVRYPVGAKVFSLSQEHGRVDLSKAGKDLKVADKLELWVRDINGTLMLFDRIFVVRGEIVQDVWTVPICGVST
ncbi:MAG: alanine racemase [Anaerolineales bacterium]|nr:alanine racemase [Anaerolineales bacterium]